MADLHQEECTTDSRLPKVTHRVTILPKIDVVAVVVQELVFVLVSWVLWLAAAVLTSCSNLGWAYKRTCAAFSGHVGGWMFVSFGGHCYDTKGAISKRFVPASQNEAVR